MSIGIVIADSDNYYYEERNFRVNRIVRLLPLVAWVEGPVVRLFRSLLETVSVLLRMIRMRSLYMILLLRLL